MFSDLTKKDVVICLIVAPLLGIWIGICDRAISHAFNWISQ